MEFLGFPDFGPCKGRANSQSERRAIFWAPRSPAPERTAGHSLGHPQFRGHPLGHSQGHPGLKNPKGPLQQSAGARCFSVSGIS